MVNVASLCRPQGTPEQGGEESVVLRYVFQLNVLVAPWEVAWREVVWEVGKLLHKCRKERIRALTLNWGSDCGMRRGHITEGLQR